MEITLGVFAILVIVGLVAIIALQLRKPAPPADNQSLGLLQNRLNSVQERLDKFGEDREIFEIHAEHYANNFDG